MAPVHLITQSQGEGNDALQSLALFDLGNTTQQVTVRLADLSERKSKSLRRREDGLKLPA